MRIIHYVGSWEQVHEGEFLIYNADKKVTQYDNLLEVEFKIVETPEEIALAILRGDRVWKKLSENNDMEWKEIGLAI